MIAIRSQKFFWKICKNFPLNIFQQHLNLLIRNQTQKMVQTSNCQ